MGSPQATIRPLIIHKRNSLETFQRPPQSEVYPKVSSPEIYSKADRNRSRRFSLPIPTIPETNETLQESKPIDERRIDPKGARRYSLEQNKFDLIQKAKELEREAYRALFQAEYLRWQAENDHQNIPLNPSIPTALSLKAEELGLRSQDLFLKSKSTVSLKSSESTLDKRASSLSGHHDRLGLMPSPNMNFSDPTLTTPTSPSRLSSNTWSPCLSSPLASSSGHFECDDSELKPILLRTGKRTLKKAKSRAMASRSSIDLKHPERRPLFTENNPRLPATSKRKFRIKCPFSFLLCCYRRRKYQPCRQSMDTFYG